MGPSANNLLQDTKRRKGSPRISSPWLRCTKAMGTMRTPLNMLLSLLYFSHYITTLEVPICNTATYGKPTPSDCKTLFEQSTSQQYMTTRFFDDEQLRVEADETWPGVPQNPFDLPIVQLPKYFSMSKSSWSSP